MAGVELETESREPVWAGPSPLSSPARSRPWALGALRVEGVWAQGIDGRGVVVGILDSGASAAHRQLVAGFRGGDRSWLDPSGGSSTPRDGAWGHGSGVLSCAVGRNLDGVTVGVAPAATWVACAALPEGRFNNVLATRCADWVLRRARPDVVINAWQLPRPGCRPAFHRIVGAWRTAEILPVFAAGNRGPEAGSGRSPANYAGLAPDGAAALAVGGLAGPEVLYGRSSRGPSPCGGSTFPRVTAPAAHVTAAFPVSPETYLQAEGTSFAAGLVAGVAALLIQRHPEAPVGEIEAALAAGAADLGEPGPDPLFGHGRVDAAAALAWLARARDGGSPPRPDETGRHD